MFERETHEGAITPQEDREVVKSEIDTPMQEQHQLSASPMTVLPANRETEITLPHTAGCIR
jgi:hypothetical protein